MPTVRCGWHPSAGSVPIPWVVGLPQTGFTWLGQVMLLILITGLSTLLSPPLLRVVTYCF